MTDQQLGACLDTFRNRNVQAPTTGVGFQRLVAAVRDLQDVVTSTAPTDKAALSAAARLAAVSDDLRAHLAPEADRHAGRREDLPGRGHPLLLPLVIDERELDRVRGRVVFSQFHLGGNGAAHGGTLPLLFDELLGRLVNVGVGRPARTAYLNVNFRAITPLDRELRVEATLDRVEGRKRFASGGLYDGDILLADAAGLFVELRPGQP